MSTVVQTQTDYEIGQDNVRILGLDLHNPVFFISAVVIVALVNKVLLFQEGAAEFLGWLMPWLTTTMRMSWASAVPARPIPAATNAAFTRWAFTTPYSLC